MEVVPTFERFKLVQIPRCENFHVDVLSKLASSKYSELLTVVPIEHLPMPSISKNEEVVWIEDTLSLMGPIIVFLQNHILPSDEDEAQKLRR